MRVNTFLPLFNGFYGSIFDIDEYEEIMQYNQDNNTDCNEDDFEFDYNQYYQDLSEEFCTIVEKLLIDNNIITSLKFEQLVSPKYYNYSNDSIDIEVNINKDNIISFIKDNFAAFDEYIRDNYISRSGFVSHYSNDADEWFNELKTDSLVKDEHQIGAILNFIALNLIDDYRGDIYLLYNTTNVYPGSYMKLVEE